MGFHLGADRWAGLGLGLGLVIALAAPLSATCQTTGAVSGSVTDSNGDAISAARIVLTSGTVTRDILADPLGQFLLSAIPPGAFHLSVSAKGFATTELPGVLGTEGTIQLPPIVLPAAASESVQVNVSQQDLAEAEIHVEEHQNLFGVIPNYYVVYDWKAPPLTRRQKFQLAWKTNLAPATILINAGFAGIEQGTDTFHGYGQDTAGYFKRFGANTAGTLIGTMTGGFLLPVLFKQDPRYFYKGTGSITKRALYAFSTCVIARGDNGKWQPAYAGILGDFASGAASNIYYPSGDRSSVSVTFINGAISVFSDGIGNVVQEFLLKHLTPHSANYPHP